jgi:hypothetical protein
LIYLKTTAISRKIDYSHTESYQEMPRLPLIPRPRSKTELFDRIRHVFSLDWQVMPLDPHYNGTGGPGNFLEDLTGLDAGNLDVPDSVVGEVKWYTEKTNLITLFHKEPEPEGILRTLVSNHGWSDSRGRLSFRHTINGRSDRFIVRDEAGTLVVRPLRGTGPVPSWTHDTLLSIAGGKLRKLLLVRGERQGGRVRFQRADYYEDLYLTLLIAEIVKGTIAVDFDAREMTPGSRGLRNHGTKFRIHPNNVCSLYRKKERLSSV